MSLVARRRIWRALILAVVIVVLLLALARCSPDSSDPGAEPAPGGATETVGTGQAVIFTITGHTLHPLSPGTSAPFDVELINSRGYPLVVTDVRLTIREVLAPRADAGHPCTIDDFTVVQGAGDLRIDLPADASTSLRAAGVDRSDWPWVGMTNTSSNQDGCKGATLRFDNIATGRRVFE